MVTTTSTRVSPVDPPVAVPIDPGQPLAWVVRGDLTESVHTGHLVASDADGREVLRVGAPEQVMFPRSSIKPVQALAALRTGLDLTSEQIAVGCASHSGEEQHLETVRSILTGAGLSEDDLGNTPDPPLSADAARAWRDAGHAPSALTQNCSGKHALMLAACVHNDWPIDTYLQPDHPLQQAIAATVAELTGEPVRHTAVDGCGAPLLSTTTTGLARAFAVLATAGADSPEGRIAAAMRRHPHLVGGTGRDVTAAMQQVPGLVAKDGAEGVYAAALPDGRAVALKIADGASRPRAVALAAALRVLGEEPDRPWDWARVPVLGHGRPVGQVRPAFGPDAPPSAVTAGSGR